MTVLTNGTKHKKKGTDLKEQETTGPAMYNRLLCANEQCQLGDGIRVDRLKYAKNWLLFLFCSCHVLEAFGLGSGRAGQKKLCL